MRLTEEHRQPAVTGKSDHLPVRIRRLRTDRLRDGVRHRAVHERADQSALAVHGEVARGPDDGGADVGDEDGVLGGEPVQHPGDVLRVQRLLPAGGHGQVVELLAGLPVAPERVLQVLRRVRAGQQREEREGGVLDGADQPDVDGVPPAELRATDVDLHVLRLGREELLVREVRAEHEHDVGVLHRAVAGGEAEQPRHADVVGVVVLDVLLAAQRVHDRGLQSLGQGDDLVVGVRDAGSGQDRDPVGTVQQVGGALQLGLARHDARGGPLDAGGAVVLRLGEQDVARDHEDRDAALLDRLAHRDLEQAGHLHRVGDVLDVDGALTEQLLRVGLLEVAGADLRRGDVRGDRQHRHPRTVRVVQAVDQVQVAGPQLPAQTVRSPVRAASAEAANAAASS